MLYRINYQHFLTHMIDHFTREELTHMQYAIISAKIRVGGRVLNVSKINQLYPTAEIVTTYAEYNDKKILEKMYTDMLLPNKKNDEDNNWLSNIIYKVFINTILHHQDVVILCDKSEDDYIDILCKILKNKFALEVIDLNELFTKGQVGPLYIDRDKIWNKAVDIRRAAGKEQLKTLESSYDGRQKLLGLMSRKDKIEKLKELGIKVTASDKKDLDKLLMEEWVEVDNK